MWNNSRDDIMDQSNDSVIIGLDIITDDFETPAHGRIEDRIRHLQAVATRATRRQISRHDSGDDSALAAIVHSGEKIGRKDGGSRLVAEALGTANTEPKAAGNKTKMARFYDCNVCLDAAKDPVLTCCGHLFCWSCFYQLPYVYSNVKECPECQGEVSDSSIIPIYVHANPNHNDSSMKLPPRPRAQVLPVIENKNNQARLGEGLQTYIDHHNHNHNHNRSSRRSLTQARPNNPNDGDPSSGIAGITPEQLDQSQASRATEFSRVIRPLPSTRRRRRRLQRQSNIDNETLQELRRKRSRSLHR